MKESSSYINFRPIKQYTSERRARIVANLIWNRLLKKRKNKASISLLEYLMTLNILSR